MSQATISFIEYELQAIALIWMAVIYTIKAVQLSRLAMTGKRVKDPEALKRVYSSPTGLFLCPGQWKAAASTAGAGSALVFII